jgi:dipeptidyl aminopeptidase/acylaminoacyl peptidase
VHIAFVRKEYEGSDSTDVWVIPAVGGAPTKISDHAFQDEQPRWLPDGMIVFTGKTERHEFPKLYVAPSAGGSESRLVAGGLDIIPNELHWSGGNTLLFSADRGGQTHIFGVDLAANAPSAFPVTSGERKVHGFDVNLEVRKMAYLANDFQNLDDVYVSDLDGGGERKLTELNNDLWKLKKIERQPVERLTYKNSIDGMKIEGFFVKPLNWQPEKKYPMVLVIHGGPNAMFGVDWYQEFQVYAAHDWAVFFCNPRGSTGYGEKFQRGIKDNWGGMDYEDVKAGMAEVLGRYNWIDREKLGVTGGSYGGFLTNWIVSHPDDRFKFKAAVTLRSISNFISDEGTRDGPYGHEDDFGGNVLDDKDKFENYWNRSPLKYARNVKTPTLILHSDKDFRVPLEQGEQWFRALQHFGVRSEMVVFPEENHNLTRSGKPKHLVQSLNWQVYWFDLFLNNNGDAKLPNRR